MAGRGKGREASSSRGVGRGSKAGQLPPGFGHSSANTPIYEYAMRKVSFTLDDAQLETLDRIAFAVP